MCVSLCVCPDGPAAAPTLVFSAQEQALLQEENHHLLDSLEDNLDAMRRAESQLAAIASLMTLFSTKVLEQEEQIGTIYDQAIKSQINHNGCTIPLQRADAHRLNRLLTGQPAGNPNQIAHLSLSHTFSLLCSCHLFVSRYPARAQRHIAAEEGGAARRHLPNDDPLHDPHHELLAPLPRLVQQLDMCGSSSSAPAAPHRVSPSHTLLHFFASAFSPRPSALVSIPRVGDRFFAAPKLFSSSSLLAHCHFLDSFFFRRFEYLSRCAMHEINVN